MEEEKVISTQDSLTPSATVHELSDSVMTGKADFSKTKMFTLAIAAGAFIAFGAQVSLTVMTGDSMMGWGFTKLIGAMTFATGLMIVALTGAELFTGNVMMTFAVLEKKVSLLKLLRSWTIVYIANFIGSKFMPEPTSENTIIGYPLSSNAVDTTWADNGDQLFVITQDRVRQLGTAISTANDWSKADYIEFDIYIENYEHFRHPFDNNASGYGISNLRLSLELYNQNDWGFENGDVFANFDQIEQYITKSGWNHVVLPKSKFEIINNCDFTAIQAWRLKFGGQYCTWKFSDLGAAELATERVVVANFIGTTAAEKGDVNGDKFVDIRDLVHLKKYLAEVEGVTVIEAAADMNGDNKVTSEDLVELRKYLLTK